MNVKLLMLAEIKRRRRERRERRGVTIEQKLSFMTVNEARVAAGLAAMKEEIEKKVLPRG